MTALITSAISVQLNDGRHPLAHAAQLSLAGEHVTLSGSDFERQFSLGELSVSPRVASAPRFIALPDGTELECEDAEWLNVIPNQESSDGPVAWLERRWWAALGAVALVAASLCWVYVFALDAVADGVVSLIPMERERSYGESSLASSLALAPSQLREEQTARVVALFTQFSANVPEGRNLRLEFRNAPAIGPNAFCLPGGIIVVTDQLVELLHSDEQVAAVVAHEIGHAHYRHVVRQLVRTSGTAIVAFTLLGDASSVAGGLGAGALLLDTKFSRDLETQADTFATQLLIRNHLPPELFAQALIGLADGLQHANEGYSFLEDHPGWDQRVARARAAASAPAKN